MVLQRHAVVDGADVILPHGDAGVGGEGAGGGLIDAGGGGPAVAAGGGQDHQRDAAGGGGGVVALVQNVPPGQEPGVVGQAEQIAEGGHDVHGTARLVHLHRLVHGAAPEDQRVAVAGGVPLGVGDAPQLVVIIGVRVGQQIGIVVGGQTDHRVIGDARCLQLLQQIGQRAFQLQIGGHIRLYLRGGVGVGGLRLLAVFGGHGMSPAVAAVTADGHVVGVEGRAVLHIGVDVRVDGVLDHLQIGIGPAAVLGELQAAALPLIVVAQIGVGLVAVVVVVDVVVVGGGGIAQRPELVAQRKGHAVAGGGVKADVAVDPRGDQAGHHRELAAGGGLSPAGLIEIAAHKALVGQAVQGGRQLLADEPRGERLSGEQDQVLALEHAGVLVLGGGRQAAEVAGHVGHGGAGGAFRQRVEVDVHGVFAVYHRRGDGGVVPAVVLRHLYVGGGLAEEGVGHLQPDGGVQPEVGHAGVGVEAVGIRSLVHAAVRQHAARAAKGQTQRQQHQKGLPPHALGRRNTAAQQDAARHRQHGQQDEGQAGQHHLRDGGAEACDHVLAHVADEAQEEVGFEIAAAAVLHADQHRPQGGNGDGDDEGRPGTAQQVDDQAPEQPRAHGEQ